MVEVLRHRDARQDGGPDGQIAEAGEVAIEKGNLFFACV
jgi:hypothetical protein